MAVKIGHASISENKNANGKPGDSTGKEVSIGYWWYKNWNVLLRPKRSSIAEKSARVCEAACNNEAIGYSQDTRNTAHNEAKKVNYNLSNITTKCNTDCSAFMTLCAIAAGVSKLEYTGNAPTTRTMRNSFQNSEEYEILTDQKYLTTDKYLKRGDILLSEGHHTVMVLENGANANNNTTYSFYAKCNNKYISIVDALNSIKVNSSFKNRKQIASVNNITNYIGTAEQNNKMLLLLKSGKLKKV